MKKSPFFLTQATAGFGSYFKALSFLLYKGFWVYLFYPLLIVLALLFAGFSLAGELAQYIDVWLVEITKNLNSDFFPGLNNEFFHRLLILLLKILIFLAFAMLSKFFMLIIMSPIMAIISERAEEVITGVKKPFHTGLFIKNVFRGLSIALRNAVIQAGITILCFLIFWIPFLGWISPLFLLISSYYFYGFSMIDYVNERKELNVRESITYVRSYRTLAISNGFVFSVIFAIPFAGAVFAPVLAPIAACIAMLKLEKRN